MPQPGPFPQKNVCIKKNRALLKISLEKGFFLPGQVISFFSGFSKGIFLEKLALFETLDKKMKIVVICQQEGMARAFQSSKPKRRADPIFFSE